MGRAKWGPEDKYTLDILTGYTATNPICLTPNFNYNNDPEGQVLTYANTSFYEPDMQTEEDYYLKYRSTLV